MGIKTITWRGGEETRVWDGKGPLFLEVHVRSFRKITGFLIKTKNKTGQLSNQIICRVELVVNGCEKLIDCDFKALRLVNTFQNTLGELGFRSARGRNQHGISVIDFGGFQLDTNNVASIFFRFEFIKQGSVQIGIIEV